MSEPVARLNQGQLSGALHLTCWPGFADRYLGTTFLSRFHTSMSRTHVCNKSHSRVVQTQASVMSFNDIDSQCDTCVLEVVCLQVGMAFELRDQALSPFSLTLGRILLF